MTRKTFASLFTGGGLADIGALNAGFDLCWGVEIDPEIASVATYNLKHSRKVFSSSIVGFNWSNVERPDHLHLSPPCQDFSAAKTKAFPIRNDNDTLADNCIAALKVLQPKTITLENVEAYKKSASFSRIVQHLFADNYWVDWSVVNSADFGVPQTRRRLILRAARNSFIPALPIPIDWAGWWDSVKDLNPDTFPESRFAQWQIDRLPANPETIIVHSNDMRSMPVRKSNEPVFTVMAGSSKRYATSTLPRIYIEQCQKVVRATPRCLARWQTVPDWYVLPSKRGLSVYLIGNGVPCLLMQRVLESFAC